MRSLTRVYGDASVVDAISFDVRPGRMTGFVGGNGAGKTTTMRMIVGILAPTGGEVLWQGRPATATDRRSFGYMPEERGLFPRMSLVDQLVFFARLHGFSTADATERARDLLAHFGLDERRDDLLDTLSLGNQQRVQIAAALVHRPTALILDEPFSGLDPLAVDSMVDLLTKEVGPDIPVLFSSHQLELVERICDDLVILNKGRVAAAGSTEELRAQGPARYRVGLEGQPVSFVDLPDGVSPAELLEQIQTQGRVTEFAHHVEPLSSIFREVTR